MPVENTFGSLLPDDHAGLNYPSAATQPDFPVSPRRTNTNQSPHGALFRLLNSFWDAITANFDRAAQRFIPESCAHDPETNRQARLICGFGHLGAIFGVIYASFYVGIGHRWGALVVAVCSTGFGLIPWSMKRPGSLHFAGNLLSLNLILGFSTLCCLEGGMQGH